MPRSKKGSPPAYRLHSSGQARVTVRDRHGNRRDVMLGPWQSAESKAEYQRVLALLTLHDGRYPFADDRPDADGPTVDEVILAWWEEAEGRYGRDSLELDNYRHALRPLRELYGHHPAAGFSPKCMKRVRQRMVDARQYQVRPSGAEGAKPRWLGESRVKPAEKLARFGGLGRAPEGKQDWVRVDILASRQALSRKVINRHLVRVRAVFSWAVQDELIPGAVAAALREVKGLRPGEKGVKESAAQSPAFWGDVEKVAPHCPPPVAAMLRLQWLTGMRSGEVRVMRTLDLDRADPKCWVYRPGSDAGPHGKHKNSWRGQDRAVPLGPQCVELLAAWVREDDPAAYLFSPRRWMEEYRQRQRDGRKTPPSPRRQRAGSGRVLSACYTKVTYPQAVKRACARAGVQFRPYALRHGRKMDLARTVGSRVAAQ